MSVRVLNPNAEVLNNSAALPMTINAAKGLQDVLKTNLGPTGTTKMYLVSSDLFVYCFIIVVFPMFFFFCLLSDLLLARCRLVGGSGDIKLTKDGNTLLKEMVSPNTIDSRSYSY